MSDLDRGDTMSAADDRVKSLMQSIADKAAEARARDDRRYLTDQADSGYIDGLRARAEEAESQVAALSVRAETAEAERQRVIDEAAEALDQLHARYVAAEGRVAELTEALRALTPDDGRVHRQTTAHAVEPYCSVCGRTWPCPIVRGRAVLADNKEAP